MARLTKVQRQRMIEWLRDAEKTLMKDSGKEPGSVWVLSQGELSAACCYLAAFLEKQSK